jgi:hypothetical protein
MISEGGQRKISKRELTRSINASHQNLYGRLRFALFGFFQFSLTLLDDLERQIRGLCIRGIGIEGNNESLESAQSFFFDFCIGRVEDLM